MNLYQLKDITTGYVHLYDDETEATFCVEVEKINKEMAKKIKVKKIVWGNALFENGFICCFTKFLDKHRNEVGSFIINEKMESQEEEHYMENLVNCEYMDYDVAFTFITYEMEYFLTAD